MPLYNPAGGDGAVSSVFGRIGGVTAESGDYTAAEVGAVPASDLPLSLANGGTGQTGQQAAMNALAGAVTAAEYPRGNGTNVVMSAILAADLPAATTSAQGAVELDGTASDIQPTGTASAAGSKGQAADAKHVHAQNFGGLFGDGSDGAVVFNGTNTYSGFASLSGSTYTLTRDVYATSVSISNGVTVLPAAATDAPPCRILVAGTLTVNSGGTLGANGANATSATAVNPGNSFTGGGLSGAGTTSAGGTGTGASASRFAGVGSSGTGGNGSNGSGGAGLTPSATYGSWVWRNPGTLFLPQQAFLGQSSRSPYAPGGGGGGGDGTNSGGAGGGGGGFVLAAAWAIVNNGTISANGGNGFTPATGNCGGGGPGAGGVVVLYTLSAVTGSGSVTVAAGSPGSGVGTGTAGAAGTSGTYLNVVIQ